MDLIDRKPVIDFLNEQLQAVSGNEYLRKLIDMQIYIINGMPTVDAVRHGKWIFNKEKRTWECSECHYQTGSALIESKTNYCCECGAEMDGD